MTIAPGVMETPMMAGLPSDTKSILEALVPHPARLGRPEEYAMLVSSIIENPLASYPPRRRSADATALVDRECRTGELVRLVGRMDRRSRSGLRSPCRPPAQQCRRC